ncbi:AAC(3) family N-acetyltransferase [uncultured Helicobacter sp.]|uniref:AAC(3) family N-acetyltransferase n=1 Tax=uncultured Helicobacter sp. TaxID=175537 RepID=UPI00260A02F9|nr:AAC(3) family N-acetyltransferase [uncultured Helicobacter sp.]
MDWLRFKEKIYTTQDLQEMLRDLGIKEGDTLLVHTEFFRFGIPLLPREAFNQAICQAFIESCGKSGNIIIPSFTYSFCQNEPFDIVHSKSKVGNLGNSLLQLGGKRTSCPIFSCVIIGDLSEEMHDCKEVLGKNSIFDRLLAHKGKILTFGNKYVGYTFIHYLESLANVPYRFDKTFSGILIDEKGKITHKSVIYKVRHLDSKSELNYKKVAHFFLDLGILRVLKFGGGEIGIMESQKVAKAILEVFAKDYEYFLA